MVLVPRLGIFPTSKLVPIARAMTLSVYFFKTLLGASHQPHIEYAN
jgi:hypothetical protein